MTLGFSKRYFLSIFYCLIGLFLIIYKAHAVTIDETDPVKMMQAISDELVLGLQQHKQELNNKPKVIYDLVYTIVIPHIDTVAMTKLVLGRTGYQQWKQATPEKQQEFQKLLIDLIIGTYVSALQSYDNEKATVYQPRDPVGDQKRVALNSKIFNQGGPAVNMMYILSRTDNTWKIIDFSVEGVSLVQSYRNQFSSLLAQGGIDNLIKTLQEHNDKNKGK
jgi:phospholipid transport system substrate-binding protein